MVTDLRDNRDPELLGFALLGLAASARRNGADRATLDAAEAAGIEVVPFRLSVVADQVAAALAHVPAYGSAEAASMRPAPNGHVDVPVECPACHVPRALYGRWLVCMNESCERYEETNR